MEERGDTSLPVGLARKRQRQSDLALHFVPDLGDASDAVPEDTLLGLFNLELRANLVPLSFEWAVKAKKRAEGMRFGQEKYIQWWHSDNRLFPLERVRLKSDTGVHAFQVDADLIGRVALGCALAHSVGVG